MSPRLGCKNKSQLLSPSKTLAVFLLFCALSSTQAQEIFVPRQLKAGAIRSRAHKAAPEVTLSKDLILPFDTPWKEWIAEGYFPYHRVTRSDFPVNDKMYAEKFAMTTYSFLYPQYDYDCKQSGDKFIARITAWKVMSGIYRPGSNRKSWFTDQEIELMLPHEQVHLDINEIHGKRLENMGLDKLPIGEGRSADTAIDNLQSNVRAMLEKTSTENRAEQAAYDAKTSNGRNKLEQKKAEIIYKARLKREGITYGAAKR